MLKPFTKFVNFKAHTGLGRKTTAQNAEQNPKTTAPVVQEDVAQPCFDTSELSWSADSGAPIAGSGAKTERWFPVQEPAREAPPTKPGRISFQGLTATPETADRLEALLGTNDQASCLEDIFKDMKADNHSVHSW